MSIAVIIIIITVAASLLAFQSNDLMNRWLMKPYAIKHGNQWYRFLTSGLIHANWLHLFFNMFVLYSFGPLVNAYYSAEFGSRGWYYFILLYIGGLLISDLPTYAKHQNHPWYSSLGASGAISSVLFAFVLLNPLGTIYLYFIPMPGIVMGVLYLAYSWYMSRKGGDNINHDAHFYGAVFGIVYTLLLRPSLGLEFINQLFRRG
ncbi:MAG: rhomboid family intramembrane serine protease [Chitinophagales bacterium]|jgi:membrane associated rhomboid family serine protease|nr:rhomboid family intramembrane serine protease [Chitinophagales bacterium]